MSLRFLVVWPILVLAITWMVTTIDHGDIVYIGVSIVLGVLAAAHELWRVPDEQDPARVTWKTVLGTGGFVIVGWHIVLAKMLLGEQS